MTKHSSTTLRLKPIEFLFSILKQPLELVCIIILLFYLSMAPFNKVEESFQTQAIHDIMFHQTDLTKYDHFEFPGVVQRSFIPSLLIAIPTYILHIILFNAQQSISSILTLTKSFLLAEDISPLSIDYRESFRLSTNDMNNYIDIIISYLPLWLRRFTDIPPPIYPKFLPSIPYLESLFRQQLFVIANPKQPTMQYYDWIVPLILSRTVMALCTAIAIIILSRSIKLRFGRLTSNFFLFFILSQFHISFYGSRVLANSFALQSITIIFALLLQLHNIKLPSTTTTTTTTSTQERPKPIKTIGIPILFGLFYINISIESLIAIIFAFTIVIIRCDMLIYLATCILFYCIIYPIINWFGNRHNNTTTNNKDKASFTFPQLPLFKCLIIGLIALLYAICLSAMIDTYFWAPHRTITTQDITNKCAIIMNKINFATSTPFICSEFVSIATLPTFSQRMWRLWNSPQYILPYLYSFPPVLPELQMLIFNTIENRSSEWGTSPWYWYFTTCIPKMLLTSLFLFPIAFFGVDSISCYFKCLPSIFFDGNNNCDGDSCSPNGGNNIKTTQSIIKVKQPTTEFDKLMNKMEIKADEKKKELKEKDMILTTQKKQQEQNGQSTLKFNSLLFSYFLPIITFIAIYSILPHKELRFIFPILPSLLLIPAIGMTTLITYLFNSQDDDDNNNNTSNSNKKEQQQSQLLSLAIETVPKVRKPLTCFKRFQILCLFLISIASLLIGSLQLATSALNYPGGSALAIANEIGIYTVMELQRYQYPFPHHPTIHIGNYAATTGASRFGEMKFYQTDPQTALVFAPDDMIEVIKAGFVELPSHTTQRTKDILKYLNLHEHELEQLESQPHNGLRDLLVWKPTEQSYISVHDNPVSIKYSKREGLNIYNGDDMDIIQNQYHILITEEHVDIENFDMLETVVGYEGISTEFPWLIVEPKLFIYKKRLQPQIQEGLDDDINQYQYEYNDDGNHTPYDQY